MISMLKKLLNTETINELKKVYRELSLKYHPDRPNGDSDKFIRINEAYEQRFEEIEAGLTEQEADQINLNDQYREIIDQIINLPEIEIELIGRWIWISGKTYAVKDQLNEAGFYWASQKRKWYWRPEEDKCKTNGKSQSLDKIRKKYGSDKIETTDHRSLPGA